jgi:hypothetical protein
VHVAAYIEQQKARSAPTAKLRLAALRHLFDWMVIGQIMPVNPAAATRDRVMPPLRDLLLLRRVHPVTFTSTQPRARSQPRL